MNNIMKKVGQAVEECFNIRLHQVQIKAISEMSKGYITNIETGEGKTIIIASLAVMKALQGQKVVVITPNEYLNSRDFGICKTLAEKFGLNCVENTVIDSGVIDKTGIYNSNIIYSTCSEFVFDYLRNKNDSEFTGVLLSKGIIIDEIDQVLIDNSNTNFTVSTSSVSIFEEELGMYQLMQNVCKFFVGGAVESNIENYDLDDTENFDFVFNKVGWVLLLTERGRRKLYNLLNLNIKEKENSPLLSTAHNILWANHVLEKGIDYTVIDGKISIIDRNNGRVKLNNQYASGVNLALELKESCTISSITDEEKTINGLFFFSQFEDLVGCSGTTWECRDILSKVLRREVKKIPRNKPINITYEPPKFFHTKEEKYREVVNLIKDIQNRKLPALVVAEDDNICEEFYRIINPQLKHVKLLTNNNLEEEESVIKDSGLSGSILISTLISGRGTDIQISKEIADLGGLQIVFLSRFENRRAEKQIIGRTGRQGSKGWVHYYCSLDDRVFNYLDIKDKSKVLKHLKRYNHYAIEKLVGKLQNKYRSKLDTQILHLFRRNHLLNIFENYLKGRTPYIQDVLYEIENFISGLSLDKIKDYNNCIINTKRFVNKLIEEGETD